MECTKAAALEVPSPHQQPQAVRDMLADLRNMYNNPEFSDVTFLCQDGGRVHASRLFLAARSSVLKSMLTNGMAESRMSEIELKEMSSSVLSSVLEFLYTGSIDGALLTWRRAFEVIMAARYFLLESLEATVWAFLTNTMTKQGVTLVEAARRLSVALEFSALRDSSRSRILQELVRILHCENGHDVSHYRSLSEAAIRYILKKTKLKEDGGITFSAYLRFRQIAVWCASQLDPPQDQLLSSCLPVRQSLCALLQSADKDMESQCMDERLDVFKHDLATAVEPWLSMVNLRQLHPGLLIKIIEPLNILPPSLLMDILKYHALQRVSMLGSEVCVWDQEAHGNQYTISGNGCVIIKTGYGNGLARGSMAMSRPGVYEWDVVGEEPCEGYCDIGIITTAGGTGPLEYSKYSLFDHPCGRALRTHDGMSTFINTEAKFSMASASVMYQTAFTAYGYVGHHPQFRVRVHLDLFERTCSFSISNVRFGVAWSKLPNDTFYPAIALGGGMKGRFRIELVSGAEFL